MWYACYHRMGDEYVRYTRIFAARASLALQEFRDETPLEKAHMVVADLKWTSPLIIRMSNGSAG
jgi:hypothetical protein